MISRICFLLSPSFRSLLLRLRVLQTAAGSPLIPPSFALSSVSGNLHCARILQFDLVNFAKGTEHFYSPLSRPQIGTRGVLLLIRGSGGCLRFRFHMLCKLFTVSVAQKSLPLKQTRLFCTSTFSCTVASSVAWFSC